MVKVVIPSLERAWLLIGAEYSPLWTGIYAGLAKQPASAQAIERSVWTLRHWALDLIDWKVDHSVRWDVSLQPFFVRDSDNNIIRQIRPPCKHLFPFLWLYLMLYRCGSGKSDDTLEYGSIRTRDGQWIW